MNCQTPTPTTTPPRRAYTECGGATRILTRERRWQMGRARTTITDWHVGRDTLNEVRPHGPSHG